MSERPIIFSGEMVRAILEGRKTETRRVIHAPVLYKAKQPPDKIEVATKNGESGWAFRWFGSTTIGGFFLRCPYGIPGDRLWVRETWRPTWDERPGHDCPVIQYRADGTMIMLADCALDEVTAHQYLERCAIDEEPPCWRPSIHMPKWAARLWLEVVEVRVERVQDITEAGAVREGCEHNESAVLSMATGYRATFRELWDRLNAKRGFGWDANPWVWVIQFAKEGGA